MGAVVSWKRREERLNPGEVFCDDFLRIEKGVENRRADGIKVTFSALFAERILFEKPRKEVFSVPG